MKLTEIKLVEGANSAAATQEYYAARKSGDAAKTKSSMDKLKTVVGKDKAEKIRQHVDSAEKEANQKK